MTVTVTDGVATAAAPSNQPTLPPADVAATSAADHPSVSCRWCGYELDNRHGGALCPECGNPAGPSRSTRRLRVSRPRAAWRVSLGALLAALATLALSLQLIRDALGPGSLIARVLEFKPAFDLAPVSLLLAGWWLITTKLQSPAAPRDPGEPVRIAARISLLLAAGWALWLGATVLARFIPPSTWAWQYWSLGRWQEVRQWVSIQTGVSPMRLEETLIFGRWPLLLFHTASIAYLLVLDRRVDRTNTGPRRALRAALLIMPMLLLLNITWGQRLASRLYGSTTDFGLYSAAIISLVAFAAATIIGYCSAMLRLAVGVWRARPRPAPR